MNVKVVGILGLFVALCLVMILLTPDTFLQAFNVENLIRRTALFGIISIGVAFVIITGGIDLSIGSVICLTGVLLAVFLSVDYTPVDSAQVLRIDASQRVIILNGKTSFKPGDRIRYSGGRRARAAIVTIQSVEPGHRFTLRDREMTGVRLTVDQPLSADEVATSVSEPRGMVAAVYPVTRFAAGEQPTVKIAGDHSDLRPRDQVMLFQGDVRLKQTHITNVAADGGDTALTLAADIGAVDDTWAAIPLKRHQLMSIPLAIAAVIGISLALGLLHGLLVTKLGLQSFVVTLCGLLFYRGISRWLVDDQTVGFGNEYDHTLGPLATGKIHLTQAFGIPAPFLILIFVAICAAIFLNRTIWGRYMLALGRNEAAAHYSGINTSRMTCLAYVICTGLAGLGGILFALDGNSVPPSSHGNFFELYAIAAAVLGGCSLRGGEGSILGVVIGAAVMRVLYNMITLLKISTTLEFAIIGLVILGGVIADELIKRYAARRRAVRQAQAA